MFTKIYHYYKNAKWVKWIDVVCLPIIGLYFIVTGYSIWHDHLEYNKGLLYMIAGSLGFFCGGLELLSRFLDEVGQLVAKVSEALLMVVGTVLLIIAWWIF